MRKCTLRRAMVGIVLAASAAGCQPNAPPASIPQAPAPKAATTEQPATKLRIPKIEAETPPVETADSPPAPTPPAPTPVAPIVPIAPSEPPPKKKPAAAALAKDLAPRFSPEGPSSVIMSDGQGKMCLVKVGDAFPVLSLADSTGQKVTLPSLYGDRLTIIVFWNNRRVLAREQFDRMSREIAARYGITGVSVVAINVGDSEETVQRILTESPKKFPCMLDPDRESFKKIATEKLPRTYVLDKNGKILWFDIEYSRDMLRELDNAVHLFLSRST